MAAKKTELQKILDLAGEFVTKHEGAWDHEKWEGFLKKAGKAGAATDDEGKRNLGNILEASKFFYHKCSAPSMPKPAKPAVAKKKAAAKKKAPVRKSAKKE